MILIYEGVQCLGFHHSATTVQPHCIYIIRANRHAKEGQAHHDQCSSSTFLLILSIWVVLYRFVTLNLVYYAVTL